MSESTFLFTDIQGSIRLWETHPEAMRVALTRHDELLRAIIAEHRGQAFKFVGDQVCATFERAPDAAAAALAAQRAVLQLNHENGWLPKQLSFDRVMFALHVRIALHSGDASERDGDYFGPTVNRVARLLAVGHGDQILLTHATAERVRDQLPPTTSLRDLGARRLRDLPQPEHIFQLVAPDLPSEFPPLKTLDERASNLPSPTTSLIGRETEIRALAQMLEQPHARWITLTGSGGTGKTRLALAAAEHVLEKFSDGVYFVALDAVHDPTLVLPTLAQTLGIKESSTQSLAQALHQTLANKQMLLVLDNLEHVADAAGELGELLGAAPRVRVLATSRELVRVYGEHNFPVSPLPIPNAAQSMSGEALQQNPAVQLFLERARAVRPDLSLAHGNAQAIGALCAQLDGLPLAIELVAVHARVLSPAQMLARLSNHWHLWVQGARNVPPHQISLRATMDWSYNLLTATEQHTFARLAIFAGAWTMEAAEAIVAATVETIVSLVDKSLVRVADAPQETRFHLLETVREYAWDHLRAQNVLDALRTQHANYFAALAQRAESELVGAAQAEWLQRLERDHENFRAALEWSFKSGAVETGFTLVVGLWRFWYVRGHFSEGRAWMESALQHQAAASPHARAKALNSAGVLARSQADYARAREWLQASRAEFQILDDTRGLANVLNSLGLLALDQIQYADAREFFTASLELERAHGDQRRIAISLNNLGGIANYQREFAQAKAYYTESLALRRAQNDTAGIANSLLNLGEVAVRQNELADALALYRESLSLRQELGDRRGIALSLEGIAAVAAAHDDAVCATQLYAAAAELRRELNAPHAPVERAEYENALARLREKLGANKYNTVWSTARGWSLENAIQTANAIEL